MRAALRAAIVVVMLNTLVALCAIVAGKDGLITGACTVASSTIMSAILVGGIHRHRATETHSQHDEKGGD